MLRIATLCLEVCARLRHEHLHLEKPQNSFQRKRWKFFFLLGERDEALLVSAVVVSMQCHHEGWVGACFPPAQSLRPWACLHEGLITMPWSPFRFLPPLHSSLLSVSVLTLALCRSFILRFSMVFGAGFLLPLSWLMDMSLFMSSSFWFPMETLYGHDLYFPTCWALYMYCVWSLIKVFGLPFEWLSVDVKKRFCQ